MTYVGEVKLDHKQVQWNTMYTKLTHIRNEFNTVKPVHSGHLGTSLRCPDSQGVLIFQVS